MNDEAHFWDSVPLARQIADDYRDDSVQHQIVALWMRGTRVLGYGVNQKRYAKLFSYFYDSLHAEADLVRRFGDKLKGGKVCVYRFNNGPESPYAGEPLCAKPCILCSHLLNKAQVAKVVYVTDDGIVETIKSGEFSLLKEDPAFLTKSFLDRGGREGNVRFTASKYLA